MCCQGDPSSKVFSNILCHRRHKKLPWQLFNGCNEDIGTRETKSTKGFTDNVLKTSEEDESNIKLAQLRQESPIQDADKAKKRLNPEVLCTPGSSEMRRHCKQIGRASCRERVLRLV